MCFEGSFSACLGCSRSSFSLTEPKHQNIWFRRKTAYLLSSFICFDSSVNRFLHLSAISRNWLLQRFGGTVEYFRLQHVDFKSTSGLYQDMVERHYKVHFKKKISCEKCERSQ